MEKVCIKGIVIMLLLFVVVAHAENTSSSSSVTGYAGASGTEQGANCDAVVATVEDLCKDFVVGEAPPAPAIFSPCCKALRQNRENLPCLCGRVKFSSLNQKNLILTSAICLVSLQCD